jgi:hypothetical protein
MVIDTTPEPAPALTSRRAVLAAAAGAAAAFGAAALARPASVRAADGNPVVVGGEYTASTVTGFTATTANALYGTSSSGIGVAGDSTSGIGVTGHSSSSNGVFGHSTTEIGVYGRSTANNQPALLGQSVGNSTGVQGMTGGDVAPAAAPTKTGVYGYAAQDANSVGVRGESPAGFGVYGKTITGFAGYFNGKVFSSMFVELAEIVTPAAPGGNRGRLFMRDNGSGKTQLCVKFPTGGTIVLATQP